MMPSNDLIRILRALRLRWMAQLFVHSLARCLLVAGLILVITALAQFVGSAMFVRPAVIAVAAALATLAALAMSVRSWPSLSQVAARADRLGETRDRLVTALAFAHGASAPAEGMSALAARECTAYLQGRNFAPLFRWRLPSEAPWLLIPIALLALFHWHMQRIESKRRAEQTAAQSEVAGTVRQLAELSREVQKTATEARSEVLQRISEQLRRSSEQVRAVATSREQAEKAALRELSSLEDLVKQIRNAPQQITPEERDALAKALEENPGTRDAAAALKQGDSERAAKALEEASNAAGSGNPEETARAEQALKQSLNRLAQQRALSEALRKLAAQAGQPNGANAAGQSLLHQLAAALRTGQQGASSLRNSQNANNNNPAEQQTLKQLLSALQNMKQGEHSGSPSNAPGASRQDGKEGKGDQQILVPSSGSEKSATQALIAEAAGAPSGRPGTEHDAGTTDSPLGKKLDPASEKHGEMVLKGQLGEGESLSQFLPASGEGAKASRRYKELYEAMAPAAQDAVLQEDIPLGSRFFIKRYFEAIRPKE